MDSHSVSLLGLSSLISPLNFSIMVLRFTHIVGCITSLFLFNTGRHSLVWAHPFVRSPADECSFFPVWGDDK